MCVGTGVLDGPQKRLDQIGQAFTFTVLSDIL